VTHSNTDRILGCLIGIATGDAIGKQTEMLSHTDIARWYPDGIRGFEGPPGEIIPRYVGNSKREWRIGETTDDTERTMAVARAIIAMHENLGDHLTIDDLARSAMFSKFHFTRIFQRTTGLSPGRFLAALRLAEAKRLLVTTRFSVADIGHQEGYNSVGTFSARFSGSVGVAPTRYRQLRGRPDQIRERSGEPGSGSVVRGQLSCPPGTDFGPVFVGLFPARILEGFPARYQILPAPEPFLLSDVPTGTIWRDVRSNTVGACCRQLPAPGSNFLRTRTDGRATTAVEIQRTYLKAAMDFYACHELDQVTKDILVRWEDVLDKLERDPRSLAEELDWAAKRHMIESYMDRKGCGWNDPRVRLMDLQYHDIRPDKGLYYALERSHLIERIVQDVEVVRAEFTPPSGTRAYFRGRCIGKFSKSIYGASWTSVLFDVGNTTIKKVPLMDPLRGTESLTAELLDQSESAEALLSKLKA